MKKLLSSVLIAGALLLATQTGCLADGHGVSLVIRGKGRDVSYELDGKRIEYATILTELGTVYMHAGKTEPVAVIAHGDVSIRVVTNIMGVLGKIGFSKVRYFYFTDEAIWLHEIDFSRPAIPFSLQP